MAGKKGKSGIYERTEKTRKKMSISRIGKKYPCSEETKKKIGKAHLGKKRPDIHGEKCHLWKGGITSINFQIRNSLEYKIWRRAVFERDNFQCVWGGKEHGNKLHADHIKPFSLYPELRFAIDNGRTLCRECHKTTDTYLWKIKK